MTSASSATRYTANWLSSLPERERSLFLASLSPEEKAHLTFDWRFWARDTQLPPEGGWRTWLLLGGRGSGKTRTGAEWCRGLVESGKAGRLALVAPTAADARDILVEGESGIMACSPPWARPLYEPSKRRLTWSNGAIATVFSADEPDRLRGHQSDSAWCDEICHWPHPETWDMLLFGLRLGDDPRCVVTTTPKPTPLLRTLMAHPSTATTRDSSYANRAHLAPAFFQQIVSRYEGTRLGRQELLAEILTDVEGALWTRQMIEDSRVPEAPPLSRVVVGVDPAVTFSAEACETGIVVAGIGEDGDFYVVDDRSLRGSPQTWASRVVTTYHTHQADRVIVEVNNGGLMCEETLHNVEDTLPVKQVTATRGKLLRAEPIAALYEQGRVHHAGAFPQLEDQLCEWVPGDPSPDRLDALVWALTELSAGNAYALPQALAGEARDSFIQPDPFGSGWNGEWR